MRLSRRCLQSSTALVTRPSPFKPAFNPYTYTEGRWLDQDAPRRAARHLSFDFQALLDIAIASSPGARSVVKCDKQDGGLSRAFSIELDNGRKVIARVPHRDIRNPGLSLSSEVATLKFVKRNTTIPVPRVLAWSSSKATPVGLEYIIMDAVPGVRLSDVWNEMPAWQHVKCIFSIGLLTRQLCQFDFESYGALWMKHKCPGPSQQVKADESVVLGPANMWMPHGVSSFENRLLPVSLYDYYAKLLGLERLQVDRNHTSKAPLMPHITPDVNSTNPSIDHAALINKYLEILQILVELPEVKEASRPILFPRSLHLRNIYVDENDFTKVTGIISWQASSVEPAFIHASRTPNFAEQIDLDDILDAGAEDEMARDPNNPLAKAQLDTESCAKMWSAMAMTHPGYREAYDLRQKIVLLLAGPHEGWLKDMGTLRIVLHETSQMWNDLNLPGSCPYQPTAEEKEMVKELHEEFEYTERMKEFLSRILLSENNGWVAQSRWPEVVPIYRVIYNWFVASHIDGISDAQDREKARCEADSAWPFDFR